MTKYLLVICCLHICIVLKATIYYVSPTGSGSMNGTSWANASNNLQTTIDIANAGDEIWVAAGTYKPQAFPSGCSGCTSNRDFAFLLKDGVIVYGGFSGTETLLSQRNFYNNLCTLSGDFNGDDVITGSDSTLLILNNNENAYHVLISLSNGNTTTLDGFTIKGGNANGTNGITLNASSVASSNGGGLYLSSGALVINNCIMKGNSSNYEGGAINNNYGIPTLTNLEISYNNANYGGGGMLNYSTIGGPLIQLCSFIGNRAGYEGGAISNQSNSNTIINNSSFSDNYSGYEGGAICNQTNSNVEVSKCIFKGNKADYGGGGIENQSWSNTNIVSCYFHANKSNYNGGGVDNQTHNSTDLVNSCFSSNSSGIGGAIANHLSSNPMNIINCTLFGNIANQGGGIDNWSCNPNIENCIIWQNIGGGSPNISNSSATPTVSYSNIEGGYTGIGNININPNFLNATDLDGADNLFRTSDDGLMIVQSSPCINASNPFTNSPMLDITGNNRVGIFDMGAYEYFAEPTSLNHVGKSNILVYPNPVKDILNIEVSSNLPIENTYVTNLMSQVVLTSNGDNKALNITNLPNGFYILYCSIGGRLMHIKFLKE